MKIIVTKNEINSNIDLIAKIASLFIHHLSTVEKIKLSAMSYTTLVLWIKAKSTDGAMPFPDGGSLSIDEEGSLIINVPEEYTIKRNKIIMRLVDIWAPVYRIIEPVVLAFVKTMMGQKDLVRKAMLETKYTIDTEMPEGISDLDKCSVDTMSGTMEFAIEKDIINIKDESLILAYRNAGEGIRKYFVLDCKKYGLDSIVDSFHVFGDFRVNGYFTSHGFRRLVRNGETKVIGTTTYDLVTKDERSEFDVVSTFDIFKDKDTALGIASFDNGYVLARLTTVDGETVVTKQSDFAGARRTLSRAFLAVM